MLIEVIQDIIGILESRTGYSPSDRGRYGYNTRGNQRYRRNNNNNR